MHCEALYCSAKALLQPKSRMLAEDHQDAKLTRLQKATINPSKNSFTNRDHDET